MRVNLYNCYRYVVYFLFSGNMEQPAVEMAKIMLNSIALFARGSPANLKIVQIVIFPGQIDVFQAFTSEMMKNFGTEGLTLLGAFKCRWPIHYYNEVVMHSTQTA